MSRPGASCRRCATTTGSTPGCAASSSTRATRRRGDVARWAANVRVLPTDGPDGATTWRPSSNETDSSAAFRRLSPEQSAIFVLHHYVGLTLPEVADELGVPLGTVKSRLHYATQALRAALDADARTVPSTERLA